MNPTLKAELLNLMKSDCFKNSNNWATSHGI